jgi:glycine cleavage system H protein
MTVPASLHYSDDHEWIQVTGSVARIGITDYAQQSLGDVVYVQVPEVGQRLAVGESVSEVESTKSVSDVYAPLSGTVVAINEAVVASPETINSDPYGAGWLYELEMADISELDRLLDAAAYQSLIEG